MNTERNTQQSTAFCKERWILHSGIPGDKWFSSNVGLNEDFLTNPPELEELEKVIKIFEQRERVKQHSLVTAVIGEEDFLPLSFLQQGAKKGAAVCRIARYFSKSSFKEFIDEMKEAIAKWGTAENFNTAAKLKEIFLIPDSVAKEIFSLPNPERDNALWDKEEDAGKLLDKLEALKDSQLAKINPIPIGTGFLVGGTHLLTNQHVLPSAKIAEQCVAQFNYEDDGDFPQASIDYEFDPKALFVSEPSLDYTLVQLKSGVFTRQAGYRMGWIQLIEDDAAICPGLFYLQSQKDDSDDSKDAKKDVLSELFSNAATTLFGSSPESDELPSLTTLLAEVPQELINKLLPFQNAGLWSDRLSQLEQDHLFPKPVFFLDVQTEEQRQAVQEFRDWKGLIGLTPYFSLQGVESGDLVFIIQHPKGRRKQIVLGNNKVIDYGLFKNFLRYRADTDYGSSGSPVFNAQWRLVALHHAAIPKIVSKEADHYGKEKDKPAEIIAQQGIRICRIVADLKKKSFQNPKLESFIQDFVITAEQLNYPSLPAVVRLNGGVNGQVDGHFNCGNHESLDISEAITCEAWIAKYDDEDRLIFHRRESKPGFNGYSLELFEGRILVRLNNPSGGSFCTTKKLVPQDGLWHHIAFTWSKIQKIQVYIDGEQQEPKEGSSSGLLDSSFDRLNASVLIGDRDRYGSFGVAIAEVRLWKTVRSQTQIKETMYRRLTGDHSEEGLIGYWQFEEDRASQTYVYNLASPDAGSNVPSIDPFTPSPKIQPQFGLELNGKNDYIDCGSFAIGKAITFEAWIKSSGENSSGENSLSFIAAQGGSSEELGYSLFLSDNKIQVYLQGEPRGNSVLFMVDMPSDNDWHHIAFTWSSDLPYICVYIDDKKEIRDQKSFEGPIGLSAFNFCIGRNKASSIGYFRGSIAEVRLWNMARSGEQIRDAMNRPLSEEEIRKINQREVQLVGYWPLNEQAGNEASNLVNQDGMVNQPGLVYGGAWLKSKYTIPSSQGKYGVPLGEVKWLKASECPASLPLPCGLKFDDKDNQVNCGNDPRLNVTDAITVEVWVKHRFGNCLIVNRGGYVEDGYSLCWHDGKIRVIVQDQTTNQQAIVDTKENAPVDQVWHHIAFTWDAASHEIFIYVDGRQQDCVVMQGQTKSVVHAGQTKSTGLFFGSLTNLKTDLVIGRKTEEGKYYDVAIAEVRLWKVVRTQDQIKNSMTCRLSRRDDDWQDLLGYWRLDDGGEGNTQARNLISDSNHGVIQGAQWYPAPPASASSSQSPTSTENPNISPPLA